MRSSLLTSASSETDFGAEKVMSKPGRCSPWTAGIWLPSGSLPEQHVDEGLLVHCPLQALCLGAAAEPFRLPALSSEVVWWSSCESVLRLPRSGAEAAREVDRLRALAARTGPCRYPVGTVQSPTP